ncbi:hypothetical protein AALT_g11066 [Alternaria alternata]|nr:hypothetical protein AALT_g11066 [Alternaria alternata]
MKSQLPSPDERDLSQTIHPSRSQLASKQSGDLNGESLLSDEPHNSIRSNSSDKAGEDGVNTVDGQSEHSRRGSITAENTDTDVNPSMTESSRVEQSYSSPNASNDLLRANHSERTSIVNNVGHKVDRDRVIQDSEDEEGNTRRIRKRPIHNKLRAYKVPATQMSRKRTLWLPGDHGADPIEDTEDEAGVRPSGMLGTKRKRGRENNQFNSRRKSDASGDSDIHTSEDDPLIIPKHKWIGLQESHEEHDKRIGDLEKRLFETQTALAELKQIVTKLTGNKHL